MSGVPQGRAGGHQAQAVGVDHQVGVALHAGHGVQQIAGWQGAATRIGLAVELVDHLALVPQLHAGQLLRLHGLQVQGTNHTVQGAVVGPELQPPGARGHGATGAGCCTLHTA